MKRSVAAFISLILCLLPFSSFADTGLSIEDVFMVVVDGVDDIISGRSSGLSAALTTPDGESFALGVGQTNHGISASYSQPTLSLLLADGAVYLSDEAGSVSVTAEALLSMLMETATGVQPMPMLTDSELQLLVDIGMRLLNGIMTSKCLTLSTNSNTANFHIDLDGLMDLLDELVPKALFAEKEKTQAFLDKYTPFLFGQTVTLEQLTALWSELGVKNIRTGLTLDIMLFVSANGVSLNASCLDWNIRVDMDLNHFAFNVTSPKGITYAFDTTDLLTVIGILSTVSSSISEEAFSVEHSFSDKVYHGRTIYNAIETTHIKIDLALVVRDLVIGLKNAINVHSFSVDLLLKKYQPWIDLFIPAVTRDAEGKWIIRKAITAESLIQLLDKYQIPQSIPGEATIVVDQYFDTVTIDGYLSDLLFEADICTSNAPATFDAAIRLPGRYSAFEMSLTGSIQYDGSYQYTLSCTEDLGGFNSITVCTKNFGFRGNVVAITTDTDIFHLTVDNSRNSSLFDIKLGSFSLSFAQAFYARIQPQADLHASWPGGFVNLIISDNCVELDSNYLGFANSVQKQDVFRDFSPEMPPQIHGFGKTLCRLARLFILF